MGDILINFPTNIGDTVLCLPALDRVSANYPNDKITAIASLNTEELLSRSSLINKVIVFNKLWSVDKKIKFCLPLINKFDLMVDFKNSFLPVILNPKKRTKFIRRFNNFHAKDRYIYLVKNLAPKEINLKGEFILSKEERKFWDDFNLSGSIFIACSSKFFLKSYPKEYLRKIIDFLIKDHKITILGDSQSVDYYNDLLFKDGIINLVGKTKLYELFYILKNAKLVISVDCSILHIASYLNLPIVALFGPTDPNIYGPWSKKFIVLKAEDTKIKPETVIDAVFKIQEI